MSRDQPPCSRFQLAPRRCTAQVTHGNLCGSLVWQRMLAHLSQMHRWPLTQRLAKGYLTLLCPANRPTLRQARGPARSLHEPPMQSYSPPQTARALRKLGRRWARLDWGPCNFIATKVDHTPLPLQLVCRQITRWPFVVERAPHPRAPYPSRAWTKRAAREPARWAPTCDTLDLIIPVYRSSCVPKADIDTADRDPGWAGLEGQALFIQAFSRAPTKSLRVCIVTQLLTASLVVTPTAPLSLTPPHDDLPVCVNLAL